MSEDGTPHSLSPDVAHLVAVEQDDQEFLNYISVVRDQMPKGVLCYDGTDCYAKPCCNSGDRCMRGGGRRSTPSAADFDVVTGHASAYAEDAPGATVAPVEPPPMQDVRENPAAHTRLPVDSLARKNVPMATGVLDYFPDALADVAMLSKIGNDKHNPGEPLHWAREKSTDHADCIIRHMTERTKIDTDGRLHATKVAWRSLAQLQVLIEELRAAGVDY